MNSSRRSAVCSLVVTRIVQVAAVLSAVFLPKFISILRGAGDNVIDQSGLSTLTVVLYICLAIGFVALICLNRLLKNIIVGSVFVPENVKMLRYISWCSIAVGFFTLFAGRFYLVLLGVAIAALFIGLVLRVVKNVMDEAVMIKTENDFTI